MTAVTCWLRSVNLSFYLVSSICKITAHTAMAHGQKRAKLRADLKSLLWPSHSIYVIANDSYTDKQNNLKSIFEHFHLLSIPMYYAAATSCLQVLKE